MRDDHHRRRDGLVVVDDLDLDVLDYVIGAADTWPRFGPIHHQHQNLQTDRVCWTKYTLPWSYEGWRWDASYVYRELDHAIDGARRWEYYTFSDAAGCRGGSRRTARSGDSISPRTG